MGHPRISIIAAMARNRVIGIANTLPWRLPEDLKHFKALTLGHHILMGRKTYESLGRPLPGRTSVVITRSQDLQVPGCLVANSIAEAVAACNNDDEIFFIGGENLYRQALDVADRIYLTEIKADFSGDAWFPEFDTNLWREAERKACKSESGLECDFLIYDKKP
ncbi:dihydrofolate reductase [Sulfuricella denitrificans skB26]|uniref:Dihydrofolate reductase n=1 Tax=Sulfuricella denitrificans (strain DSM 22764 / NBRC 105220 / skB26) TaxID=1163617 RepID=S6B537_SULDS|nr:dihydrofolate reductase [Sulfuricella denitrificans]BAN35677.1 dihydrofolate reductase [Sulfuricella denitrificans skB26]